MKHAQGLIDMLSGFSRHENEYKSGGEVFKVFMKNMGFNFFTTEIQNCGNIHSSTFTISSKHIHCNIK
jgi:hypothetical protein